MSTPFTAGTSGYASYRIPALIRTHTGTLIAFAEGRKNSSADTGDIDIVRRRSTDNGATWLDQGVVSAMGTDTIGNPTVVIDPTSGDLVLLSCYNRGTDTATDICTGAAPARRVYVQRSSDDGVTWSSPTEITSQVKASYMRWYATGPGTGAALPSGRLVIPCNHSRAPSTGSTDTGAEDKYGGGHGIISDDGGVTWSLGFTSSNPNGAVNENESAVALMSDGRLYLNCRDENGTLPGNRADAYSTDGGLSLTKTYRPQGTLHTSVVQGNVLAVGDILLYSGPNHPTDRSSMAIWASRNQGVTWNLAYRVTGLPSAYSCMALLDDGTVGLLYETGDFSPNTQIEFTTIPLTDLGLQPLAS